MALHSFFLAIYATILYGITLWPLFLNTPSFLWGCRHSFFLAIYATILHAIRGTSLFLNTPSFLWWFRPTQMCTTATVVCQCHKLLRKWPALLLFGHSCPITPLFSTQALSSAQLCPTAVSVFRKWHCFFLAIPATIFYIIFIIVYSLLKASI